MLLLSMHLSELRLNMFEDELNLIKEYFKNFGKFFMSGYRKPHRYENG